METEEKRYELFGRLFYQNINHKQILSTVSLLEIWPPFQENRGEEKVWYRVLLKLITDAQDCSSVVKIIQEKMDHILLEKKVLNEILNKYQTKNNITLNTSRYMNVVFL